MNDAGINEALRNSVNEAAERAELERQIAEQGSKLAKRFKATEGDYRSFHDMLDAQNRRPRGAEGHQPDDSSPTIVLAQGYKHPEWGTGKLVAKFSRISSPYIEGSRYYTQVNFFGNNNPDRIKPVLSEMFGAHIIPGMAPRVRQGLRTIQPGVILMPMEYTPDMVEELRDQLAAVLPDARETFSLLLTRACDPALNPDLAEAARAYRDDLTGAGWPPGPRPAVS